MSIYEIISVIVAFLAIFISIQGYRYTKSRTDTSLRLTLTDQINSTKDRIEEVSIRLSPLINKKNPSEDEKNELEALIKVFNSAVEKNLNSYEQACSCYLKNDINKKNFKNDYRIEIRKLVENPETQRFFTSPSSPYKAILAVYNEWNFKD